MRTHFERLMDEKTSDTMMFRTFARLHPIEAYDLRPSEFCEFMRSEGYDLTDDEIKKLIDETR